MSFDPLDRFVKRRPSGEYSFDSYFLQFRDIPFRDHAPNHNHDVIDLLLFHFLHQFFADRQVGTGHDGEADDMHIFLDRRIGDLIDGLMEASVDDFHPCIAEGLGHHLCPAVVAIQTRFCN